jgi:hypothetical protein
LGVYNLSFKNTKYIMLMLSAFATYAHSTMSIYRWYKMIKLAASEKLEAAADSQSLKHRNEVQVAFACSPCKSTRHTD